MQPGCLVTANNSRHAEIVDRTISAIKDLRLAGKKISFYAVAERAQVSRSTLYRSEDLRKLVEAARADGVFSQQTQHEALGARIAELEDELARVSLERDELEQAVHGISPVRYAFIQAAEAA